MASLLSVIASIFYVQSFVQFQVSPRPLQLAVPRFPLLQGHFTPFPLSPTILVPPLIGSAPPLSPRLLLLQGRSRGAQLGQLGLRLVQLRDGALRAHSEMRKKLILYSLKKNNISRVGILRFFLSIPIATIDCMPITL